MVLLRVNSAKLTATSNASASNTSKLELLRDLEPKTLNELLRDDLPRWVKFPDVEKCEWLNKVIAGMWPWEFVASISALLHQQSTESSLGSIDDEQMTTDVDLLVVTENSEVVVSLSNPILHLALNVEISDFVLRVAVSFIEKPAPAGDAVYEPNGAASTLNDSSQDTERSCGAPLLVANKVLIPFVDDQSMLDMESLVANHSCGVLLIRGLQSSSNFAGQMYQFLMIDPQTQDLFATLECSEILQSRKQVDSAWIRLDHLKPRVGCAEHASFGCVGDRRAEFEVSWYPFARPRGSQQEEEAPLPDDVARTGVVFMKLLRCERLASMDVNRTLDPYVVFSVGCRTKQSTVKRHTFNPIWDPPESFELLVADYQHDEMSVLVMDSNLLKTDDTVSRVQIGLEPVQRTHRLTDIWLLEGNCGSVTLEPGWRGC
ncbi:hypothetical protein PC115_g12521 [Phytophthora cactorum]|uniref:C2 domain-containing protein n=1 Tax=Phytophthora cactorum TaxID=29920 RepID=A0A8T1BYX0_9STRA|nr:hypothetical protein PC115_g12521 [Phytophthora cactorum]